MNPSKCCCASAAADPAPSIDSGSIPVLSSRLTQKDIRDGWKARWGIGRMRYTVRPGLYKINDPSADSPVLVSANYKLTVDKLRKELTSLSAWILVLDTRGINVWCAAGKGTFGTEELIRRIADVRLDQFVRHRRLILPQLGAPGVAAHEVKKQSGFAVSYGPVRAEDIPKYLRNGRRADAEMRRVRFPFRDRLALIPRELIPALRWMPVFMLWVLIVRLLGGQEWTWDYFIELAPFLAAVLTGSVLFQILLPWLPFRSFALGGWVLGALAAVGISWGLDADVHRWMVHVFLLPPVTAYLALNFTGSTPFTSLSGVQRELRISAPLMVLSILCGMAVQIIHIV